MAKHERHDEPSEPGGVVGDDVGGAVEEVFEATTQEQLRALGSLVRHRMLRILRDGPATITQLAERLEIAKGSSNHHLKILAKAGIVHVVETRKVRGVVEQYYGMVAPTIRLPDEPSGREMLMRHALADIEAAPPDEQRSVRLKHARLSRAGWQRFEARVQGLFDELAAAEEPDEQAADLFVAFYRPKDMR
jgi:DNA-binding transcriptional ArsR family regulator